MKNSERFEKFVKERESIRLLKEAGQPKPWTRDPILQSYRFCNIYREHDTVSRWIESNWIDEAVRRREHWLLFFPMVVARMINWPSTLEAIGYPVPFRPAHIVKTVNRLSGKIFTGAYMIRAEPAAPGETKINYLVDDVFKPLWKDREKIVAALKADNTCQNAYNVLSEYYGMGSFMTGQVIADMKRAAPLKLATDGFVWATPGPGSRRGLNRLFGYDLNERLSDEAWITLLHEIQYELNKALPTHWESLDAQNVQNCLCEFDKYERVRLGEGRPRSLYDGR